ncbi:MAG: alpha-L-rhamnosidase N-terminal domain-containing protein [Bacteroidota bacterium]|nr:alpha-L-rhamnosidase N-terminal domain-containing protein [Bacteroidota bacterium]
MKKLLILLIITNWTLANDAYWIGNKNSLNNEYQTQLFRKKIDFKKAPTNFEIFISADQRFKLNINGQYICYGPSKGDHYNWYGHTIDIAQYLKSGSNIIAVEVVNRGPNRSLSEISNMCGLFIKGKNVESEIINSDESWKTMECTSTTPILEDHIYVGSREQFMSSYYPWGWKEINFDDTDWKSATKINTVINAKESPIPLLSLKIQPNGVIRSVKNYNFEINPQPFQQLFSNNQPTRIGHWSKISILYDHQQLTNAFPVITFSGAANARISIRYAESLYETQNQNDEIKGHRDSINNKFFLGYYDEIIPDGKLNRTFSPSYFRTFRYMLITINTYDFPLTINGMSIVSTGYPFEEKGVFQSSDPELTKIWNVGIRTAKLCAADTYMDCPYFEQLQYIGDTRIQGLISLYAFEDDRLIRKALTEFKNSIGKDSLTRSRYPDQFGQQIIPPFSLFYIVMLHDLVMHRPALDFAKEHKQSIQKILSWHKSRLTKENLLGRLPYWNFVDWTAQWKWVGTDTASGLPPGAEKTGKSCVHLLQYILALQKSSNLMELIGDKELSQQYKTESQVLIESVRKYYWDDKLQLFTDFPNNVNSISQHAQAMAILTGACKLENEKKLIQNMFENKSLIQASYYYQFYLLQAMKKAKMSDLYLTKLDPWKKMLQLGLTTFAERDEPTRSDCHAWSASPVYDMLATVLGVEPGSEGFNTVKILPNLGYLDNARGSIPTPKGVITVSYIKNKSNTISASIYLPDNLSGTLSWKNDIIKLKSGKQVITLK